MNQFTLLESLRIKGEHLRRHLSAENKFGQHLASARTSHKPVSAPSYGQDKALDIRHRAQQRTFVRRYRGWGF
jgi:hypothetical protein